MAAASNSTIAKSNGLRGRSGYSAHPEVVVRGGRWRETQPACRRQVLVLPGYVRGRGEGMRARPNVAAYPELHQVQLRAIVDATSGSLLTNW